MANSKDEVSNSSNKGSDTTDLSPEDLLVAFIMKQSTAEITDNPMAINFLTKSIDGKQIGAEEVVKNLDGKEVSILLAYKDDGGVSEDVAFYHNIFVAEDKIFAFAGTEGVSPSTLVEINPKHLCNAMERLNFLTKNHGKEIRRSRQQKT